MKIIFLSLLLITVIGSSAQNQKNYLLELDGDTVSIALDVQTPVKLKNGQTVSIKLKQKSILQFADEMMSFQYPAKFNLTKEQVDDDVEQILCMTATGNGLIIQRYKNINPENMVDLMLDEITSESKDAGYAEVKNTVQKNLASGRVLNGKKSTLTMNDEISIYTVYPAKIKKGGLIFISIIADDEDVDSLEVIWKTLDIKN